MYGFPCLNTVVVPLASVVRAVDVRLGVVRRRGEMILPDHVHLTFTSLFIRPRDIFGAPTFPYERPFHTNAKQLDDHQRQQSPLTTTMNALQVRYIEVTPGQDISAKDWAMLSDATDVNSLESLWTSQVLSSLRSSTSQEDLEAFSRLSRQTKRDRAAIFQSAIVDVGVVCEGRKVGVLIVPKNIFEQY